jgi:hypothetical protein
MRWGPFPDEEAGVYTRPSPTEESTMPIVFIEAPAGVRDDLKKRMVENMTAALEEAGVPPTSESSLAICRMWGSEIDTSVASATAPRHRETEDSFPKATHL